MTKPCEDCYLLGYRTCDCLDAPTVTVDEVAGLFEGGPDSVEWLREQRNR